MIKLYDLIEKRSQAEPKYQTTVVSSPLRGQNQDQTGYGVKNDVADYTISDSAVGVAGVSTFTGNHGTVSGRTPQVGQRPSGRVPAKNSGIDTTAAASERDREIDNSLHRNKELEIKNTENQIARRKHSEKMRDQEAEKIKNKPMGTQTEAYVRSDVNTTNTHGHDDPSDSAAARITGVAAKQPAPKKPIKTPLPPKDPKAKQKANPAMTKSTILESKTYMTFADFIKVSEGNIAEATRASIAKAAAVKSAREAGVKINEPKKPAKENPIKLRAESYESEAYLGNHEGLRKYAHAHGGIDADDMLKAAHHMEHGNIEGLKHHLHGMDTDPRDFVLQHVHKGHWNKLGFEPMKEETVNEISLRTAQNTLAGRTNQRTTAINLSATAAKNGLPTKRFDDVAKKAGDKAFKNQEYVARKQMSEAKDDEDHAKKTGAEATGSGNFIDDMNKRAIGDYHTLKFKDGNSHQVHTRHVRKARELLANTSKPVDKEKIQNSLYHSHDRFMKTVNSGKAVEDAPKPRVSLGGSSKIGGSKE
jgi:hypothetical protein